MSDITDDVTDIEIERADHLRVTYADGEVATFGVRELRAACPCASCRGWRERGQIAWPRPGISNEISITAAELAGAWGISITWSDGHDTGIYSWSLLRRWWRNEAVLPGDIPGDLPGGLPGNG